MELFYIIFVKTKKLKNMTREEQLKLYNAAKEAYYNGEEIMSDIEFDALEKELGLENKSYVGARHHLLGRFVTKTDNALQQDRKSVV